jgi:hypothetical protein
MRANRDIMVYDVAVTVFFGLLLGICVYGVICGYVHHVFTALACATVVRTACRELRSIKHRDNIN